MIELRCTPAAGPASQILLERGLARDAGTLARHVAARGTAFLLADPRVLALHGALDGWQGPSLALDAGEGAKTFAALEHVVRAMAAAGLDRGATLVALGGGSLGDLAGLAASIYLRGVDLVQVPTTLLAMVDSSIGGKNAINLPEGKNLVGTVHAARRVLIDPAFLENLPEPEFRSGLGEVLKVALGLDAGLFALLRERRNAVLRRDPDTLVAVIERCVAAKILVVEGDLREQDRRRLLNLGHTLGHALEAHAGFTIPHGTAVARGLHFALDAATRLGVLGAAEAAAAAELLAAYGFACTPLPPAAELLPFLARDKKCRDGVVTLVLPNGRGTSTLVPTPLATIEAWLRET
ncbi:MAG: 3-dehydroquinate synthase [Planctomycetes bacterium]|nr:3-dehydroquinate synthase [Planctomycetota bacterium]